MITFKRKNDQISSVVLDTSGIIDGRILEIAKAGFIPQNVVVPQFVIAELQFLADHGDTHKRERARYGLDVIRELQDIRRIEVSIAREKFQHIREVDDKLVALAKQYGAMLYTTDFNLNKVAQIEGVAVLNVNELAHALRPNLLPGERVTIKLTQVGQDKTQGVGYLNDGTMVVVEQASRYVGHQVQAVCTRILQTQAGKMMFATLASKPNGPLPSASEPKSADRSERPSSTPKPERAHQHNKHRHADQHGTPQSMAYNNTQQPATLPSGPVRATTSKSNSNGDSNARPLSTNVQKRPSSTPQAQQSQLQQRASRPKQQNQQGQKNQRRQGQQKRLSPEDSLLATLKEIQK